MNSHATLQGLSQAQIEMYWNDGYLFPLRALSGEEAAAARADLETIERVWLDNGLPLPLNTYKRVNAHVVMPLVARLARTPAILDAVEGILGEDVLIYAAELFIKEPRTKQIVTMHQDLTYWGLGAIDGMVTAWLALSPAVPDSGCMDFVRGSHKNPILPHEDTFDENNLLSRGQEVKVDVAPEDRVPIVLQPGEFSLHHGLTIHGSGPNISDDRRIACVIRYIRPDMKQETGMRDFVMPARGKDEFGHFEHLPSPEADFSAASLAVYEDIRAEQARILMRGAKGASTVYG